MAFEYTEGSVPTRVAGGRWVAAHDVPVADEGRPMRVVIRRLNPWSTVRLAALWSASLAMVAVLATVVLWVLVSAAGLVGRLEKFMTSIGFDQFKLHFGPVFRFVLGLSIVGAFAGTVLAALAVAMFNAIARLVGGIALDIGTVPVAAPADPGFGAQRPGVPVDDTRFDREVSGDGRVSSARSGL